MASRPLTPKQIRALPWPKALLRGEYLTLDETYKVGMLLADRVYKSDRSHGHGRRPNSLRALCDVIPNTSAPKLVRAIQVFEVFRSLGISPPFNFKHAKAGHFYRMWELNKPKQKAYLKKIEKDAWSVEQFKQELRGGIQPKKKPARRRKA